LVAATFVGLAAAGASDERSVVHPSSPAAEGRLVLVETYMRDVCGLCAAAAVTLDDLAARYAERGVLFLEHDTDNRKGARFERWQAAAAPPSSLPLTLFDSGYEASGGPVDVEAVFVPILESLRARRPGAEITGEAARAGDALTITVRVRNVSGVTLHRSTNGATLHALLYEPTRVHHTGRFVRDVASAPLETVLAPGATGTYALSLGPLVGLDWELAELVVLLDYRPGGAAGPFHALQAARVELPESLRQPPVVTRWRSGDWTLEIVDRPGLVGTDVGLVLDRLGRAHIAYRHYGLGTLRHAWRQGGAWTIQTIDDSADVGQYASLAVDHDDRLYVSYYDRTHGELKVAVGGPDGWRIETVDAGGHVGLYTSVAVGPDGRVHVVYVDGESGALKHALRHDDAWRVDTVDADANHGADWSLGATLAGLTSVTVDATGRAHVAYYDDAAGVLRYAVQFGDGWRREVADGAAFAGLDPSIAVGPDGVVRIAYCDFGSDRLKLAARGPGGWTSEVVDADGLTGMGASLALDPDGGAHVMYREYGSALGPKQLRYAERRGGLWGVQVVDPGPKAGRYPALALDAVGEPHVAYFDDDYQNLRYAERATPVPFPTATPTLEPTLEPTASPTATGTPPPAATAIAYLPLAQRGGG
jgi:hypothetical protein